MRRGLGGRWGAWLPAALALWVGAAAGALPAAAAGEEESALEAITAAGLRAHMGFLADDVLEGRATASRGMQVAAAYLAARFAELGLEPAGDGGSYLQRVPLHRAWAVPAGSALRVVRARTATQLAYLEDFAWSPSFTATDELVEASLVVVGYGVTAPELGYDDYAGVDVRGKVVLLVRGAPAVFSHDQRAYYSSSVGKLENAVAHGAVGVLLVRDPTEPAQPVGRWQRLARGAAASGAMTWDDQGEPADDLPGLRLHAVLSDAGAKRLLASAHGRFRRALAKAARGKAASFATRTVIRARQRSRHESAECVNVAALLPGSDTALAAQHVVYSAHLDHLGLLPSEGAAADADLVHNGAYDNASGIAALLEIAKAFAAAPRAPRRSVLFLAVTGEEKGLQGAKYFLAHPTVPRSGLIANFNLDMFLMLFPVRDLVAFGAEHSTLRGAVERASARTGFAVSPDPYPEEVIFVRSDQYAFVRAGVPAVFLVAGFQSGDPAIDGEKVTREWLADKYHSPQDDLAQPLDLDSGVRFARANFLAGLEVANAATRPEWNPGDFFGVRFGRQEAKP
jgi:Peptidase family M28/PA domain